MKIKIPVEHLAVGHEEYEAALKQFQEEEVVDCEIRFIGFEVEYFYSRAKYTAIFKVKGRYHD